MLKLSPFVKKLLGIVGVLVLAVVGYGAYFLWGVGNNVSYAPTQPIPFSHKRHAGENHIPCLYCHANADNSKHATVPSMNVCMNCHQVVKTESPHIKKLTDAYNKGEPIEWIKVHDLPDFVHFSHKRHVLKEIDCSTCHGDVANMVKIKQVETLQMGFCLDCHKKNKAPMDCYTCHK